MTGASFEIGAAERLSAVLRVEYEDARRAVDDAEALLRGRLNFDGMLVMDVAAALLAADAVADDPHARGIAAAWNRRRAKQLEARARGEEP